MLVKVQGRVDYLPMVQAMQAFTQERGERTDDELWICEHPPVFTQGLAGKADHVLDAHDVPVVETNRGGPAEKAGLRGWKKVRRNVRRGPLVYTVEQDDRSAADIIVAVDGETIESGSAFLEKIEEHRPGDTIVLTILRGGERMDVQVELGSS